MMTNSPAAATGGPEAGEPSVPPSPHLGMPVDVAPRLPITGADKVAYAFYVTAAFAALTGQVWAGVEHIDWPANFNTFTKIVLVTPAVAVLELGGVATAGLADVRRRMGETAYVYRTLSILAALAAVVFNLAGHWTSERAIGFGFASLSAFAYILWLAHSSARRRDSLRHRGMLSETAPVYGIVRWVTHPKLTWRARSLALEYRLGLYESLSLAGEQLETEQRDQGIKDHVSDLILQEQGEQHGPIGAKIAVTTYDMSRVTAMLKERLDYDGVVDRLSQVLRVTGPAALEAPVAAPELEATPVGRESAPELEPTPPPRGGGSPLPAESGDAGNGEPEAAENSTGHVAQQAPHEDSPVRPDPEKVPVGGPKEQASTPPTGGEWTIERIFALLDSYEAKGTNITGGLLQAPYPGPQLPTRTATRRVSQWKKAREDARRSGLVVVK